MMERYKEYKDSGVKWLGEIPSHWEIVKLKRCAIIKTGTTPPTSNLKYFENGDIPWFTPGDINDMNLHFSSKTITKKAIKDNVGRLFPAESIYFVGIGATVGKVAACDFEASSNQQINAIMCNDRLDYKFATYCLLMEQGIIRETTNFVTLPILNQSSTGLIDIVLPPLPEQDSIVRYLDSATSEIDKAIAMQQKMIDLLNERKQIIIQNAVTKGLDENVEMKESGVEWIGRIPKHWEVGPFKRLIKIKNGADYKKYEVKENGYPVIGSGGVFAYSSKYAYDGESLLLGRKGTIDKPLYYKGKFWTVDTMFYGIPKNNAYCKYLYYQSLIIPFKMYATSTAIPSMTQTDLYNNPMCIPSKEEQEKIARFLDSALIPTDTAITNCQRQITLLQERKQIIINEVVTGKVRVS